MSECNEREEAREEARTMLKEGIDAGIDARELSDMLPGVWDGDIAEIIPTPRIIC